MNTSGRLAELALKKRMLRQRSTVLRHTLALQVNARVAPALGVADRAVSSARWLGRHPYWLVAAGVALTVWRPQGVTRLLSRGLWLWQSWTRLQPVLMPLLGRLNTQARQVAGKDIGKDASKAPTIED